MEKLVFKMDEIPDEGLSFDLVPDPAVYGIEQVKVLNPPGVSGWVKIVKEKAELVVSGEVNATLEVPCNRCLGPAAAPVGGEFFFRMVPRSRVPEAEEVELSAGDLDIEFFSGDEVDVRSIIAEQVYLGVPIRVLCKADCRGLCPQCGQDLNVKDCGHRPEGFDPRWSALKNLKQQ